MTDININYKKDIVQKLYKGWWFRFSSLFFTRLLSILRVIIFARLFLPEYIGLANLTVTCLGFLSIFGNFGFSQFIIKEKDISQKSSDTVFTISFFISICLLLICFISAPLFSCFFTNNLNLYIYFLAIILLEIPLKLPSVFWEKKLKFGYSTLIPLITEFFTILTTILAELLFHLNVFSLLIGTVSGLGFSIIYIWLFAIYRPKFNLDKITSSKLFSFGTPVMVQGFNGYAMSKGDNLMVAKFWGNTQLAYYNFAWQMPLLISAFVQTIDGMLLPVYSKFNENLNDLRRLFNLHNKIWSIFGSFFGMFLILYADIIVLTIYGEKWIEVVPILRIMAISFVIRFCTGYGYDHLVIIKNRTSYMMKWGFVNTVLVFTLGLFLIKILGPIGGAWFWVIQCITLIPLMRFTLIYSELKSLNFLNYIWQPVLCCVISLISGFLSLKYLTLLHPLNIVFSMLLYILTYILLLFIIDKQLLNDIKKIIKLIKSI